MSRNTRYHGDVLLAGIICIGMAAFACDDEGEDPSGGDIGADADADTDADTDADADTDTDTSVGEGEVVVHLLSDLSTEAAFFEFQTAAEPSVTVTYFGVMGSDDQPHFAFDACDVCWVAKLGYTQDGDIMRCENWGSEFPIDGIGEQNTAGGGCWPGHLPIEITETEVRILHTDLENGSWYFE